MKKYLITGALSLVACATLTSCHSDEEFSDSIISNKLKTYEEVFKEEFGEINSTQDWGFGAASQVAKIRAFRTRAANENHNQWYSTEAGVDAKYSNLEKDPDVTNEERIGVFRYMNHADTREKTNNIIWTDYFVSQVWDGGTNYILNGEIYGVPTQNSDDPRQYTNNLGDADNKITNNGVDASINGAEYTPFTRSFANQNGETVTLPGGDYMDYLFVNETGEGNLGSLGSGTINDKGEITGAGGWTHVNNFNSANNTDPWYAGKTWMTDNSGTYDFAYNQTEGSYFSNKYLIIPGTEIFANDATMLEKYGEYYYVCFDYEKGYTDAEKATEDTYIWFTPINKDGVEQQAQKVTFTNTYYTNDNLPTDAQILAQFGNGDYTSIKSGSVSVAGYKTGSQHFAGDNNYTDWIVRISPSNYNKTTIPIEPGTPGSDEVETTITYRYKRQLHSSGRIFCEDLGVIRASDIDFNDIVFDAYIYDMIPYMKTTVKVNGVIDTQRSTDWVVDTEHASYARRFADIFVLAGGGTLETTVAGQNLKDLWGSQVEDERIINTIDETAGSYGNPFTNNNNFGTILNYEMTTSQELIDIPIVVSYDNHPLLLTANPGVAPHKLCVPIETPWPFERIEIKEAYPGFSKYVGERGSYSVNENQKDQVNYDPDNCWTTITEGTVYFGDGQITGKKYSSYLRVAATGNDDISNEGYFDESFGVQDYYYKQGGSNGSGYNSGDPVLIRRRN